MESTKTGTMMLNSFAAASLFEHEIKGQMSDGQWENTQPEDHWNFWYDLDVVVGAKNHVESEHLDQCKKAGYALSHLIKYIGHRMINIGRMASSMGRVLTQEQSYACEYMPETFEEWVECNYMDEWKYKFIKKYMDNISFEDAKNFYSCNYTGKDMRSDLNRIERAIKSVKIRL